MKIQLGHTVVSEKCAPHRDFKALFFYCFDQNGSETCKSGRYLVEH